MTPLMDMLDQEEARAIKATQDSFAERGIHPGPRPNGLMDIVSESIRRIKRDFSEMRLSLCVAEDRGGD